MTHTCHAPGCSRSVPPKMFACRNHWYALPKPIRDAIWFEYRSGQEQDKRPSFRYLAVQQWACGYLAFRPDDESAALEALEYLKNAVRWARRAIEAGAGDPLVGLRQGVMVKGLDDGA